MKKLNLLAIFLLVSSSFAKAQDVKIGDIYTFDDNSKGVVFYVDGDGHGLAASFDQEKRRWEEESNYVYCQDIVKITNESTPDTKTNMGLGMYNTSFIIEQLGEHKASAAKYARHEGIEWYLPSAAELYQLIAVANINGEINKVLTANGCKKLKGWYWTSSEYDNGDAWRISDKGKIKRCSKLATRIKVKAIRQF